MLSAREGLPAEPSSMHATANAGTVLGGQRLAIGVEGHLPGRGDGPAALNRQQCLTFDVCRLRFGTVGRTIQSVRREKGSRAQWDFRESSGYWPTLKVFSVCSQAARTGLRPEEGLDISQTTSNSGAYYEADEARLIRKPASQNGSGPMSQREHQNRRGKGRCLWRAECSERSKT